MRLYLDNDIVIKLAVYDLLEEFIPSLACVKSDAFVLATARWYVKNNKRLRQMLSRAALAKASVFIDRCTFIPDPPYPLVERLVSVDGIDAGEAVLFAAASQDPESIILTDDKKSLRALSFSQDLRDVCGNLEGRCLSLCGVMLAILNCCSYETVRKKICSGRPYDSAIDLAFSDGLATRVTKAQNRLRGDLVKLESTTDNLLREWR